MRGLFLFLFALSALGAAAQLTDSELEKITEKNKRLIQDAGKIKPGPAIGIARTVISTISILPQDGTPCLVPDTKVIVAIPNALPELKLPEIAAIPNPVLQHRRNETLLHAPGAR